MVVFLVLVFGCGVCAHRRHIRIYGLGIIRGAYGLAGIRGRGACFGRALFRTIEAIERLNMKYFFDTIKHKWFVLLASFRTGLPLWLAITHDLSKFSRSELPHYNRKFFGDGENEKEFALAWHHHQNSNDHHWEWWILKNGICMPMSNMAILHMLTDWIAVRRAQYGTFDPSKWERSIGLYGGRLHPDSLATLLFEVRRLGLYRPEAWSSGS